MNEKNKVLTIKEAAKILGQDFMCDEEFGNVVWSIPVYKKPEVRYSRDTLMRSAEQNRTGGSLWHLGFSYCMPFARQYEILHYNPERKIKFDAALPLLEDEEAGWARHEPMRFARGLYLIDFKKRFLAKDWFSQRAIIESYGGKFERAPEEMVVEFALNFQYMRGERLLSDGFHWGGNLTSTDCRVMVRENSRGGLVVDEFSPEQAGNKKLGACIVRLWDF